MSLKRSWTVAGTVVRVIDGDTIEMNLDLGWRTWLMNTPVRIYRINCPEMNTAAGKAARARVVQLCPPGDEVVVVSRSLDKYGRVLGSVILAGAQDLGTLLLAEGHAVPMEG